MHTVKKTLRNAFVGLSLFLWSAHSVLAQINTNFTPTGFGDKDLIDIVLSVLSWILGILALIAVVIIVYAGVIWMTAQGAPEKITKAKDIIKNAVIGLVIVLAAWSIVLYLIGVFGDITGTGTGSSSSGSDCVGCSFPNGGSSFYVLSTYPEAGETNVYLCTDISVRMSDFVDPSTVIPDTFFLRIKDGTGNGQDCSTNNACASGVCTNNQCVGDTVAGTIGFGPGTETKYFNLIPNSDLEIDTAYEAFVVGGASGVLSKDASPTDSIDDRLSMSTDYQWFFTTGSDTDVLPPTVVPESVFPADGEVNVCTNTVIGFDFSEPMRITTFNDDVSFLLDSAGDKKTPVPPDWIDPLNLKNWSFGNDFDYVEARPETQLTDFSSYAVRLFGGDAANNFAGAITDSCGNALDGDADTQSEGSSVDNYYGFDPVQGETESPITWETGENADCTPVIDTVTQEHGYYGEDGKLRDAEACTANDQCGSGACVDGQCQGNPTTSINISGLYLAPHPEVRFEGSVHWAAEDLTTCFDQEHFSSIETNTSYGDICLDEAMQSPQTLLLRTPVGAGDTSVQVSVADVASEPSTTIVDVQSPHIKAVDPTSAAIGQYVTILGDNFGTEIGSVFLVSADKQRRSQVSFPETCGDTWTDKEIIVVVPETYTKPDGTTGTWQQDEEAYFQVINSTNSRHSDLQLFTFSTVVRPNLCNIVPTCQDVGGAAFTITGNNFGNSQGSDEVAFALNEEIGYNADIQNWSDAEITGTTSTAMTQSDYWVTVYDSDTKLNSNGRTFTMPCQAGPSVVEFTECSPSTGAYPYPNPQNRATEVCINANVAALFDQKINPSTLNTSTVLLDQYNSGSSFNGAYKPLSVKGRIQKINGQYTVDGVTYYSFQFVVDETSTDANQDSVAEGTSAHLQPDTWYQLTITTGVTNENGVAMASPYTMRFHTKNSAELCTIETVDVTPVTATHNSYFDGNDVASTNYASDAYGANCQLLESSSYSWNWSIDKTNVGTFGKNGATHTDAQKVYVAGDDEENEGTATVTAAVESINDNASFIVDLGFCTSNADCVSCSNSSGAQSTCNLETNHCTPVIKEFAPTDGDHGTWVTVSGCMFGSGPGNAYWNATDDAIHAVTAWPNTTQCAASLWSEDQIIIEVPEQYDTNGDGGIDTELPKGKYNIEVETRYADSTESSQTFEVNDTRRPGLCDISPDKGTPKDVVYAYGQYLGETEGYASFLSSNDVVAPEGADRISAAANDTDWKETQIITTVPLGVDTASTKGKNGFLAITAGGDEQCANSQFCSNPVDFITSCNKDSDCASGCCSDAGVCQSAESCSTCVTSADCVTDKGECVGSACLNGQCSPVIESLVQDSGPVGSPVTINGCYFGSYKADTSAVTFSNDTAALLCGNYWTNKTIIAEVPKELETATDPTVNVTVKTAASLMTPATEDTVYTVTAQCPDGGAVPDDGLPVLCSLNPTAGYTASQNGDAPGISVGFYGEHFQETDQENVFYGDAAGENFTYFSDTKTSVSLPYGALTGPAEVQQASGSGICASNGLDFVVQCRTASDCADQQFCIDNECTDNPCGGCTEGTAEDVCGTGQGCALNDAGVLCCAAKPYLSNSSLKDGATAVCPNSMFSLSFSEKMHAGSLSGIRIEAAKAGGGWTPLSTRVSTDDGITVIVSAEQTLATNTTHRLVIPSNPSDADPDVVSDATGLTLSGGTVTITFTTGPSTCVPDSVTVLNDETNQSHYTFIAPGSTTTFTAYMHASDGQLLAPSDTVGWEFTWSPYEDENSCANVAWVNLTAEEDQTGVASATSETQTVTSGNENAKDETITVAATPTASSSWTDVIEGNATVSTFFCAEDEIWEYVDDNENDPLRQYFRLIYCDTASVPTLNLAPAITSGSSNDDFFRQYLFINAESGEDAFGVRVYENTFNLSAAQWYAENVPNPGAAGATTVDGYDAVRDGGSTYIAASNSIESQLYNNIYLFTFNEAPGIDAIAGELMSNLRFNYSDAISYQGCVGSDKQKLVRDTKRVNDLGSIALLSHRYYQEQQVYPRPKSQSFSSYLDSVTTSVWNSWQGALGNLLGETLPVDPFNFFYAAEQDDPWNAVSSATPWVYTGEADINDCPYDPSSDIYYDQAGSCWDPVNQNFFCPTQSHTYLWKVDPLEVDNAQSAAIYAHMEYESTTTEMYKNLTESTDACSDVPNADCACYNYAIAPGSPGAFPWGTP